MSDFKLLKKELHPSYNLNIEATICTTDEKISPATVRCFGLRLATCIETEGPHIENVFTQGKYP
jgi:hypothetical protein